MKRRGLPLSAAVRLGLRGIANHPWRLVIVVVLTVCALVMFGLAAAVAFYNNDLARAEGYVREENATEFYIPADSDAGFSPIDQAALDELNTLTGVHFSPVVSEPFMGAEGYWVFGDVSAGTVKPFCFSAFSMGDERMCYLSQEALADTPYTLYGRLPENRNEIALNSCWASLFLETGYYDFVNYPPDFVESNGFTFPQYDPEGTVYCSSIGALAEAEIHINVIDPADPEGEQICATVVGFVDYGDCYEGIGPSSDSRGYYHCVYISRDYLQDMLAMRGWAEGSLGMFAVCANINDIDTARAVFAVSGQSELSMVPSYFMESFESDTRAMNASKLTFALVGVVFGAFAALLIYQLVTLSINEKRDQIGVLRALGARSADVYKVFFPESILIALISIVAAVPLTYLMCMVANSVLRTFFHVSVLFVQFTIAVPIAIILVGAGVTMNSTFFPVHFMAKKQPVECIRDSL